jgi:uncharacterized protein YjbI with pentapeptide repeats
MAWANKLDLTGAILVNTNLQEAKLADSNFQNADMRGARKHYANFMDINMDGCRGCPTDWQK